MRKLLILAALAVIALGTLNCSLFSRQEAEAPFVAETPTTTPEPECDQKAINAMKVELDTTKKGVDNQQLAIENSTKGKKQEKKSLEDWLPVGKDFLANWPALSTEQALVPRAVILDEIAKKEKRNEISDVEKRIYKLNLEIEKNIKDKADLEKNLLTLGGLYSKALDCQFQDVGVELARIRTELAEMQKQNTAVLGPPPAEPTPAPEVATPPPPPTKKKAKKK
ncbi:MAG: hypothetical protein WCT37_04895 [Patescibacteria group bacterium]|jgi:hypothetical protein